MSRDRDQVVAEGVPGGKWVIRYVYNDGRKSSDFGDYRTPLGNWTSSRDAAEKFHDIKALKRSMPAGFHYLGHRPNGQKYKDGEPRYVPG